MKNGLISFGMKKVRFSLISDILSEAVVGKINICVN